ncbi:MAG: site-2 protease family protein [Polyangiales bacterium]
MADADGALVDDAGRASEPGRWSFLASPWTNLALFLLTIGSTVLVGAALVDHGGSPLRGWVFAVPLLAILVTHEAGHWLQARHHRVDASLPYFIPLPFPPLGTLGAVIAMRGRIARRDALLDIGAWGPLAGLIVAVPVLAWGLHLSTVEAIPEHGIDEGQSLLYLLMKRLVLGPIPAGHDVFLHPTAFAGWAGLFMTMLNLIPVGQLDGGHVAYALFGARQDTFSRRIRFGLLGLAAGVGVVTAAGRLLHHASRSDVLLGLLEGKNWVLWFVLLTFMTRGAGAKHPPTDDHRLSPGRRWIAWFTLGLFVLLFMPVPITQH